MKRALFEKLAGMAILVISSLFAASGCGNQGYSQPQVILVQADGESSVPWGQGGITPHPEGLPFIQPAGSATGESWTAERVGAWIGGLLVMLFGGILCRRHIWLGGVPLLAAGLILYGGWAYPGVFQIMFFRLWKVVGMIWMMFWAISFFTENEWDDRLVYGGSLILLVWSWVGQGSPLYLEGLAPSPIWGVCQFAGVFGIAPAIRDFPPFGEENEHMGFKLALCALLLWVPLILLG